MNRDARAITREDIMDLSEFGAKRAKFRKDLLPAKRLRRLSVGPDATFYFESYETMWMQVHEMLYIEKGGEAQISDELSAYNPLIPQGRELVATLMFEIDDEARRRRVLGQVGGEKIMAQAEEDVDRTTAEGKASSVHFLHFPFTDEQITAFQDAGVDVILGLEHQGYAHMTKLPLESRRELAKDFA